MPSVTVTKIVKEASGRVLVYFGKHCREFTTVEDMRAAVRAALTRADVENLALALMLSRQPSLANPAALEGRTVTVDFSLANFGTVT